jgi:hypothetical protein
LSYSVIYNFIRNIDTIKNIVYNLGFISDTSTLQNYGLLYLLPQQKFPWVEGVWKDHLQNLKDIRDIANRIGSKLLIVLIPSKGQVYPFLRPNYVFADWNFARNKVSNFLVGENIDFLDLTQIFQEYADLRPKKFLHSDRDLYWAFDLHFNIKGNKLAALAVEKCIIDKNLIAMKNTNDLKSKIEAELNYMK